MLPRGISRRQVKDVQRMATLIPVTTVEQHLRPAQIRLTQALALIASGKVTGETARLRVLLEGVLSDTDISLGACNHWRTQVPVLLDAALAETVIVSEDSRCTLMQQEAMAS